MAKKKADKMLLKFPNAHKLRVGLKVTGVNPDTNEVTSCACRFCLAFGREAKVGAKRKPTDRVKYFERFRTDNYVQHLKLEHPRKWAEYQKLNSDQDKEAFFQECKFRLSTRLSPISKSTGVFFHEQAHCGCHYWRHVIPSG